MLVVNILIVIFEGVKRYLLKVYHIAKDRTQYPDCKFYEGCVLVNSKASHFNVLFNDTQIINSNIGSHTYIQKRTTIVNADIGKFCSIASNVSVGPGMHKLDGVSTHPAFYLKNTPLVKKYCSNDEFVTSKRTIIGHDVWIGDRVIIMDGVEIGTGAVIAAGAVVTKNVLPYTIVGGVPAKEIKRRFDTSQINEILNSQWWDNDEQWLEKNFKWFNNVPDFIELVNDKVS